MNRRSALLASALVTVTILLLTLWPLPEQAYRASLSPISCLVCGDQGMQDVLQNVLMFLPLGVFLGLAGVGPGRAALAGFALSFAVELLQYTVVTGRDASLSDVVTNTVGTALGAMLAPHLPLLLRPSRTVAARLALGMTLLWSVAWIFGAWALGGHAGAGNWRGRFPGDLPEAPALNGTAVQATIGGAALGLAPVSLPLEVERRFSRDSFDLRVVIEPGRAVAPRENVVTVIDVAPDNDGNNSLVMVLNRVGARALLSYRINAARARLRTPSFSFGPAFGVPEGRSVTFQVSRARGTLRGVADQGGQQLVVEYRIAPELLWSVLAPRTPQPGVEWMVEPFLWAAALVAIAGYWAGKSRSRSAILITLAWVIAVQAVTPRFFPVAEQTLLGWAMLLGGVVLGVLAGRLTQKGPHPKMRAFQRA